MTKSVKNEIKIDRKHYLFSNKALAALIIPLVIEQILAVIVGFTDTIVVSSVGEAAVSGVSLVDQIMVLMIQIFAALATGGAVVAGQYLGQKREKNASEAATQLMYFILIVAIVIVAIIYLVHDFILRNVFGQIDAEVMKNAKTYLMIVAASIPFIAVYNGGAAIFRAMGNSKMTMMIAAIMNMINVTGDIVMVKVLGFGTEGVAIPTLLSRMTAAVIVVIMLLNQKRLLHIKPTFKLRLNFQMIKSILRIGIPNGLENSMFQIGKITVLSLVATFGTSAIAANAVGNVLATFQVLPGIAMGLAVTAVVSRCVGAGDYVQVKYYIKKLLLIAIGLIAFMVTMTWILWPILMRAYNLSNTTSEYTRNIMMVHSVFAILVWSISFVLPSAFRAAGDAKACMIIAITSMWIFRIGFAYLLGKYFELGILGVWVAMIIDWCFRSIMFGIRYFRGTWKNKHVID
ncbi:MAG: MATE family efflux transporter [Suipraeoptans sp.]